MAGDNFYTSNNREKYPNDGKLRQCKKCITMLIDNWDPDTFMWILEEVDVPWVPDEWNKILAKFTTTPEKLTGSSVIGRYLAVMKVMQYRTYRFKDTEYIQELAKQKIELAMRAANFTEQEIDEALLKGGVPAPSRPEGVAAPAYGNTMTEGPASSTGTAPPPPMEEEEDNELVQALTDEDKIYLKLKWGGSYRPSEWIILEKLYTDMMNSYDIQTAGHIDTLKMICKSSLKANQLLDIGDKHSMFP